jgi:hypothetical protein
MEGFKFIGGVDMKTMEVLQKEAADAHKLLDNLGISKKDKADQEYALSFRIHLLIHKIKQSSLS